jgi:anti-anti-sigma factor
MNGETESPVHEIREVNGVMSIHLSGDLWGYDATRYVLEAIHELESQGARRVVIDLAGLMRIDSAGLGAIASAFVSLTRASGKLVLAAAPPKVHHLLSTTMLLQVIPLYPDAEAARRALGS